MEKIGAVANYGGSTAAVSSGLLFGLTQQEWVIISSIGGLILAAIGLGIQMWVSYNRVKVMQAQHQAILAAPRNLDAED